MIPHLICEAPAKLNLFLHVVGRRSDGYHLLESVFQLIDLSDTLSFTLRNDGRIVRLNVIANVAPENDLVLRAARLIQAEAARRLSTPVGVSIALEKRIPLGGGLGGGSSDAATTLLALNRLWDLHLTSAELMRMGLSLGADVPFFIGGENAFAQGVGEILIPIPTSKSWYVVIHPSVCVPTAMIFAAPELTRDTKPIRIADFSAAQTGVSGLMQPQASALAFKRLPLAETAGAMFGRNDLEAVAAGLFPEISVALAWLRRFAPARMSGSGSCVFSAFATQEAAQRVLAQVPAKWSAWACKSLDKHPLLSRELSQKFEVGS